MKMNITSLGTLFTAVLMVLSFGFWSLSFAEGGTITACVNKSGLVYLIGQGFTFKKCNGKDQLISWNTTGPQGPKGDQGVQGLQGEQGVQGEKGDKGDKGVSGTNIGALHLFDGAGQDLGLLIGTSLTNGRFDTYLPDLPNGPVVLEFYRPGNNVIALGASSPDLFFTEAGCTGDAFIDHKEFLPQRVMTARYSQSPSYFVFQPNTQAERHSKSRSGAPGTCEEFQGGFGETYLVTFVSLPFTLPPTWPLEVH